VVFTEQIKSAKTGSVSEQI